jgi:hypothetical protein
MSPPRLILLPLKPYLAVNHLCLLSQDVRWTEAVNACSARKHARCSLARTCRSPEPQLSPTGLRNVCTAKRQQSAVALY